MLIINGYLVAFAGLHYFFVRVCSITILFLFVCFVEVFSITPFDVDLLGLLWEFVSLEGIGDLWSIHSTSSGMISCCVVGFI